MGCWNGTCGLTRLPILEGDRTVLVVLRQRARDLTGGGIVYQNDVFEPITPPIKGVYNDYGNIEYIEPNPITEKYLKSIVKKLGDENCKKDKIYLTGKTELEKYLYFIERGYIKGIAFEMFLEEAYNKVVETMGNRYFYKSDVTLKESIEEPANKYKYAKDSFKELINDNKFKDILKRLSEDGFEFYRKNLNKEESLRSKLVELILLNIAMSYSRMFWSPQAGAGHQSREYKIIDVLSNYAIEHIDKLYQQRKKDNEEVGDAFESKEQFMQETLFN